VSFVCADPDAMLWGGELVLRGGEPAGQVTSTAYGAALGTCVGLAVLRADRPVRQDDLDAAAYEVDLAGRRLGIRPSLRAPLA
jgi:glycine cleavage system aminomethyltransferase T